MFFEKMTSTSLNNTSNERVLRWEGIDATKISTSKPSRFPSQHWDFQSKSQGTDKDFVLDLRYTAQRQSRKAGKLSCGSKGWAHWQHTVFYTITTIKAPYFFCVGFKMKGDAAALFHFLLPLNKKFLFQTHLLFGEEVLYFPVSGSMDSFVS